MEKVMDYFLRALFILGSTALLFITSLGLYNSNRIEQQRPLLSAASAEKVNSPSIDITEAEPTSAFPFKKTDQEAEEVKKAATTPRALPAGVTSSGTPLFTNQSIPQQPKATAYHLPSPHEHVIYKKMKKTCDFWTKQYRQNGKELSRLNMNISCRDASNFSRNKLGKLVPANYADYKPQTPTNKNSSAIAYNGEGGGSSSSCDAWRNAIDKINRRLKAGYKENTGNQLREKRRQLSDLIFKNC